MAQVVRGLPTQDDPNLLVGPATMDDAGVYRLADGLAVVQTLDFFPPLVDDPFVFGQIAASNALSDIYAMGGVPKTAMNLVGFPDDQLELEILGRILKGGAERVAAAGAVVVGGHSVRDTEIKYGLSCTGIVDPERIVANAGARPGDMLILTKPLGTGFVTTAFKARKCPQVSFEAACKSMVELNAGGAEVMRELGVRGATDITGFGLAGHANEIAEASGTTLVIELSKLPLMAGVEELVRRKFFTRASKTNREFVAAVTRREGDLDPVLEEFLYDAQTSGGLLMCVPAVQAGRAVEALQAIGTPAAAVIGRVKEKEDANLVLKG